MPEQPEQLKISDGSDRRSVKSSERLVVSTSCYFSAGPLHDVEMTQLM